MGRVVETLSKPLLKKTASRAEEKKLFISSLERQQAHRYLAGWMSEKAKEHGIQNPWIISNLLIRAFDEFWFDPVIQAWRQTPLDEICLRSKNLGEEFNYVNASISNALKKLVDLKILGRKAKGRIILSYFRGEAFPEFVESDRFLEIGRIALKNCQDRLERQQTRKNARGKAFISKGRNPIPLVPQPIVGNFTVVADELVNEGLRTLTTAFNQLLYDEGGNKEARQASVAWLQLLTDIRKVSDLEDPEQRCELLADVLKQAEHILNQTLIFTKSVAENPATDSLLQQAHLLTAGIYGLRLRLKKEHREPSLQEKINAFKRHIGK